MSKVLRPVVDIPPAQQAIRAKCFHPSGTWIEFKVEEIEQSIPDRFEQQVARYPDRLAVKTRNQQLTYDELNRAANRVARAILAQRGEGPEPIALLFEHDASVIIALMGVLKAGKFYVPLDPSYPRARNAHILEDSQAGLIVTNNQVLSLAHGIAQDTVDVINVDELGSGLSIENPGLSIPPDAFAYIIYTSGSTGQPKGVIENHVDVLHFTMVFTNEFHVCQEDRLSLLASCSFNGSAASIFTALLNGAALFPFDLKEEGIGNLANWLIQEDITNYTSVPMVFRHFVATLTGEEIFPKLRLVKLGGDRVYRTDLEQYKKHFAPDCILCVGLGSTEVKIFRQYFMDKETPIPGSMVPVGYAVEDTEVLLLDEEGREVGPGQVGAIAVKTRYMSSGYWRRPELTQARFLPDSNGGDERIYLTGDLGCMLPDGCLVHLGRKDFQVKIRGQRVEVAEIETALLGLDVVKEAVVVAREDQWGGQRLVAYLVLNGQPTPAAGVLRRALATTLPDSMIPSAFVFLDVLPLTPTGKVDRQALPAPDQARPKLEEPFVAPRTPLESLIAEVWQDVLGVDRVGVYDNFFDLGGHSLLAMQTIAQLERKLGLRINPGDLILQTLGQLASACEERQRLLQQPKSTGFPWKLWNAMKRAVFGQS